MRQTASMEGAGLPIPRACPCVSSTYIWRVSLGTTRRHARGAVPRSQGESRHWRLGVCLRDAGAGATQDPAGSPGWHVLPRQSERPCLLQRSRQVAPPSQSSWRHGLRVGRGEGRHLTQGYHQHLGCALGHAHGQRLAVRRPGQVVDEGGALGGVCKGGSGVG